MAGHSKWANIKHRKGAQDKRRSKLFTKAIKVLKLIDAFEDDDDVQNIFHNLELTDELMELLAE